MVNERLFFVVDFVADDNPSEFILLFFSRSVEPMGDSDILYPAKIGDIINVPLLVNVVMLDAKRM